MKYAPYLVLAMIALLAYGAVLFNGSGFSHPDDLYASQTNSLEFRPLLILTYWMNQKIGGWMLTNFTLHLISTFVLFSMVRRLTSLPVALLSSSVMAAHPFLGDAIASVSGRSGILFALAIVTGCRIVMWRPWAGLALGILLSGLAYGYIPSAHLMPVNDIPLVQPLSQPEFARHYVAGLASYLIPRFFMPVNMSAMPLILYSKEAEFAGWVLLLILLAIILRHHSPAIRLGTAFIFLNFVMYAFIPLSDVVLEHRFYLAIAGFSILAGSFLMNYRTLILPVMATLILLSNLRANTYSSGVKLWEDAVRQNPFSAQARVNLAGFYAREDQWARALTESKNALSLDPDMPIAYRNVASAYVHFGNFSEASRVMDAGDLHFKGDSLWQKRLIR